MVVHESMNPLQALYYNTVLQNLGSSLLEENYLFHQVGNEKLKTTSKNIHVYVLSFTVTHI